MDQDTAINGSVVAGTTLGLAVLLYGVEHKASTLQLVGGVIALLSIGVLTWYLMALPDVEGAGH
jgi:hypothetical protein